MERQGIVGQAALSINGRERADRRQFDWRTVVNGFARSRRRAQRRQSEAEPLFTDWLSPKLFFLAIATMLLSSMDALFTLRLIEDGAVEINPLMAMVIGHSFTLFAITKMSLTGLGMLGLAFMARMRLFNRILAGHFVTIFFGIYSFLVCYEIFLLTRI